MAYRADVPSEQVLHGRVWLGVAGRLWPLAANQAPNWAPWPSHESAGMRPRTTAQDAGGRAEIAAAERPDALPAASNDLEDL